MASTDPAVQGNPRSPNPNGPATTASSPSGRPNPNPSKQEAKSWVKSLKKTLTKKLLLGVGDKVDVKDPSDKWQHAIVTGFQSSTNALRIHYRGWPDAYDEYIVTPSVRIAPYGTRTAGKLPQKEPDYPPPENAASPEKLGRTPPPSDRNRPSSRGKKSRKKKKRADTTGALVTEFSLPRDREWTYPEYRAFTQSVLPAITDMLTDLTRAQSHDPLGTLGALLLRRSRDNSVHLAGDLIAGHIKKAALEAGPVRPKTTQLPSDSPLDYKDDKKRLNDIQLVSTSETKSHQTDLKSQSADVLRIVQDILLTHPNKVEKSNMELVTGLFDDLDDNANGYLELNEIREVISLYNGSEFQFNDADFLSWYDRNFEGRADGALNVAEFGQYIADLAWQYTYPDAKKAAEVLPVVCGKFQSLIQDMRQRAANSIFKLQKVPNADDVAACACGDLANIAYCTTTGQVFRKNVYVASDVKGHITWESMPPANALTLDIGADGELWMVGADGGIFQYAADLGWVDKTDGQWRARPICVSVGLRRWVVCCNDDGHLYRYSLSQQSWSPMPGRGTWISIGNDGEIWAILEDDSLARYDWRQRNWVPLPHMPETKQKPIKCFVGDKRRGCILVEDGSMHLFDARSGTSEWSEAATDLLDASASWNGACVVVTNDNALHIAGNSKE